MRHNVIRIEDTHASKFEMEIWTPSGTTNLKFWNCDLKRYQLCDWEASDKGYIRYDKGDGMLAARNSPNIPGYCFSGAGFGIFNDLYLGQSGSVEGHGYEEMKWGMVLYDYVDRSGAANDKGKGQVRQTWVLGLQPGTIWWEWVGD